MKGEFKYLCFNIASLSKSIVRIRRNFHFDRSKVFPIVLLIFSLFVNIKVVLLGASNKIIIKIH